MITDVIYCPKCQRCYHLPTGRVQVLGCGHLVRRSDRVRVRTQTISGYERVLLRRRDAWISFLVRPDGSVEWRRKVYSAEAWQKKLAQRNPLYPAAFRARRDIDIFRRIPERLGC